QNEIQTLSELLKREKEQHELYIKQRNDIITDLKIEGEKNNQLYKLLEKEIDNLETQLETLKKKE
ncbi:unnamed protein product, partial [Brachionus calyciflorus]